MYFQYEYTYEPDPDNPNSFLLNEKANRYIVCDQNGKTLQELRIPKNFYADSLDWMDGDKSVLLCGSYVKLGLQLGDALVIHSKIYKFNIWTGEMKQLTDGSLGESSIDWISDDVLPVSPQDKKKVTWGKIKQSGSK